MMEFTSIRSLPLTWSTIVATVLLCLGGTVDGTSLWDIGRPHTKKPYDPEISTIPEYVTKYAPMVHLYSEETYWPYGIEQYVPHFTIKDAAGNNYTLDRYEEDGLRIQDLEEYRKYGLGELFLTATEDFDNNPPWITGRSNIPDIESGKIRDAPATCIVVDKGDGVVDAFWFYFYSFNLGPFVMGGGPYGNHIGDWEHSLVRFQDGVPQIVWMSAHGGGSAYVYKAMEKASSDENRPVIFSARGTHANYASVGQHSHDLPFYMLSDFTDRGPLWDPTENFLAYKYDGKKIQYANGSHPGRESRVGNWLAYLGAWGDQKLIPTDPRQKFHPFEWRYIDGPIGPLEKNLMRTKVCERSKWWNFFQVCRIRHKVQMGEGIEAEGGGCALAFDEIRPIFLQYLLRLVTWRGWGCFLIDRIWG